jgi:uncharacterized protein
MPWQFKSIVIWLSLLAPLGAAQALELPRPTSYVVDNADVIEAGLESRLAANLQELEQKTGAQMIVLTLPNTEGEPLETFNIRLLDQWKLGQQGKDNGLLFTVAVGDRKWRIDTGYGLEGLLPDSYLGSLGRAELVPRLKQGDYGGGIYNLSLAVANRIAAENKVSLSGQPVRNSARRSGGFDWPLLFFLIFFILPGFLRPRQRGYHAGRGVYLGGGFGGFGGGGFGGFGGGGGGGFGGGGAGGGW